MYFDDLVDTHITIGTPNYNNSAAVAIDAESVKVNGEPVATLKDVTEQIAQNEKYRVYDDKYLSILLKDNVKEHIKKSHELLEKKKREVYKDDINAFIDSIDRIIFNDRTTIVFWKNGDKTIVTCQEGEEFDKEKAVALCIIKYLFGNIGYYNEIFKAIEEKSTPKKEKKKKQSKKREQRYRINTLDELYAMWKEIDRDFQ